MSPELTGGFLTTGPPGKVKVIQSCLTLCDPMGYTVHGILQARILEWAAFPFSRGSSQSRNWTQVSCTAGGFFTSWATREAHTASTTKEALKIFYVLIYLFIWLCWILAAACRMLSCGMGTLSCPMWSLIPKLGIEPGSPVLWAQNPSHWTIREVLPKQKFCPH